LTGGASENAPDPDGCKEGYGLTGAVAWPPAVHAGIDLSEADQLEDEAAESRQADEEGCED
jgi:hypothetical protein